MSEGFKQAKAEGQTDKVKALAKRGIFKKPSIKQAKSSWVVLVNYLRAQELLPVVIFAFSKKVCEVSSSSSSSRSSSSSMKRRMRVERPLALFFCMTISARRSCCSSPRLTICSFHVCFCVLLGLCLRNVQYGFDDEQ